MTPDQEIKYAITADDRFSGTFRRLQRDIAGITSSFGGLASQLPTLSRLGGVVAGLGGGALGSSMFKRLVDDLDAFNDAADATGATVEKLSALEDVARRNGESLDTVVTAALKLNKVLSDAAPDSPTAQSLRRIGLDAAELRKVDPADAVVAVAKALAGFADDGNKARLTQELLGKSTRQLAAFLKDVATAGELNARVTSEQAEQAEKFNKELAALTTQATTAARNGITPLVSAINQLFDALAGRNVGGSTGISELLTVPLQAVSVLGANVAFVFKGIGTEIGGIAAQAGAFLRGDFAGAGRIGDMMKDDARRAREEFDALERRLMSIGRVLPPSTGTGGPSRPSVGSVPEETKGSRGAAQARTSEAERYLETLQRQLDKLKDLGAYEQLLADIGAKRLDGLTPKLEAELKLAARQVDAKRNLIKAQERQLELDKQLAEREAAFSRAVGDKAQRDVDDALGLLANTTTGRLKALEDQADKLLALSRKLPEDDPRQRQISEAMATLKKQADELVAPTQGAASEFDKLANAIEKSMDRATNAVLDFVVDGKGSFGDLFKAFQRDLLRDLIEEPIRDVMRQVSNIIKDTFKGSGNNALGGLLDIIFGKGFGGGGGFDLGGLFGFGGGTTGRALGGDVSRGQLVRWQENGREWFVPGANGTVLTQQQLRGMGGPGLAQHNTFVIQGGDPQETQRQIERALAANNAALVRSMTHGALRRAT